MNADPLAGADTLSAAIASPGSGPPLSAPGVTPPSLSNAGRRFLSDILVELGFVAETRAAEAVEAARHPGQTPEKVLLENNVITEDELARALAERYSLDHIDLTEFPVDESAAALLRQTAAKRYLAAPIGFADDGALVLAVADPADSLGLSDIAVMTKLPVRPAVAARSEILKLLDTMVFMAEPAQGASDSVSTVIVPPDDGAGDEPDVGVAESVEPVALHPGASGPDEATERELARLREELALAIVARDEVMAKLAAVGDRSSSAAKREREEALASLRHEHERAMAAAEAASEDALRAERASAQQALSALRAKQDEALAELRANHEEELSAERAKRVEEVEAERERTAAAIDAERERNQKELESLRARLTEELESVRAEASASPAPDAGRVEELERALTQAREQLEVTADADRRAEAARAALAALRDESERQAQMHALTERELRTELDAVRAELDALRASPS
ncbi:MAG: type pilus assembly protein PilB [Thermoleophilaceae bacterium]|nr:type pilus assembly protein PilB [Thermoleophilaceae bacterium]